MRASLGIAALVALLATASPAAAETAGVLYLNRCSGGCTIHKSGADDARTHQSAIPMGTQTDYPLSEFPWGDTEWNAIVQCVKEVYSPFKLQVTDVLPASGVAYNEAIIAGHDFEIGWSAGGVAPKNPDCTPKSYVVSFTFANDFGASQRVFQLCAVAAQESGHAYGLDHTYSFIDGSSGCRDPMTYRGDCGGQKFFRNDTANCGENVARPCSCGATQNSHLHLLSALGAGTPITRPPVVAVTTPADGATIANGTSVVSIASAQRGVKTVELWLNGYLWGTAKGVTFGANGQPEASYAITIPPEVPDGVIDIIVKAKDDIDVTTATPQLTVTKGAPCQTAATCLAGQRCETGRCFWDPPAGDTGDACTFSQFCTSGTCAGPTTADMICTQSCIPGVADSCPMNFDCNEQSAGKGFCFPADPGSSGCCSTSHGAASSQTAALLAFGLVILLRRRRR
jgi:MYXO-CTERM domain-containing protein